MRCLIAQIRCHLNRHVTLTSMEAPSPCQACRNDQPPSGSPAKPVQVGSVSLKRLTDVWFMSKHWCVYLTCMQHVVTAHWTLTYLHFIYPVHMKHCCSVCLFFNVRFLLGWSSSSSNSEPRGLTKQLNEPQKKPAVQLVPPGMIWITGKP